MVFPAGFGVPIASNETWSFLFQTSNQNCDRPLKLKQRLTLDFISDHDLIRPITALTWVVPQVEVIVDKFSPALVAKEKTEYPLCIGEERGVDASYPANSSIHTDDYGRKTSRHWFVPPGKSTWTTIFRDRQLGKRRKIAHAAWSHVHPFCTSVSL